MVHHRLAALTCALLLAGAGGSPLQAQDTTSARTGTYRLVSVAGKSLPATVEQGVACREDVTQGALTLRADGTWLLETSSREVCGGRSETESETENGRYKLDGPAIEFLDDRGRPESDDDSEAEDDLDDLTAGSFAGDGGLTAKLDDGKTMLVFSR